MKDLAMKREEIEAIARDVCPASFWYDLMDTMGESSDEELCQFIEENCQGNDVASQIFAQKS